MKTKHFSVLIIAAAFLATNESYADSIVRMASAQVAVNKTTMTKVNGKYQKSEAQVCIKKVQIPVVDKRVAGQIQMPPDAAVDCISDVKGKQVHIMTTPIVMLADTTDIPWKTGVKTDLKVLGALSFVYSEMNSIDIDSLQETLSTMNYSEDLSLKELGITLIPRIVVSSGSCSAPVPTPPGGNPPCNNEEKVNLEEYFSSYIYIEDKGN